MPSITSTQSAAADRLSAGNSTTNVPDRHRFSVATWDKAPLPPGYVPVGPAPFVPAGSASAVQQDIYQSSNGDGYAIRLADQSLAPVKIIAEVSGQRRVYGLAHDGT